MIRITNSSLHEAMARALRERRNEYSEKQIQVTTGRNFQKRSDDVANASQASRLDAQRQDTLQFQRNVQMAKTWTQVSGAKYEQMLDNMQRINEVSIEANTGTMDATTRTQLAKEVDSILEDMLQVGNSRHADAYLFAGTASSTAPLTATRDADNKITAVAYNGNSTARTVQISEGQTAVYGHPGDGSTGVFSNGTVDTFDTLIKLRDQLAAGEQPDTATVEGIQNSLEHSIGKVVENGLQQQRLISLDNGMMEQDVALEARVGELANLDLAKAFTELNQLEASLQASLQMSARVNQLSLMNYL